MVMNKTMVALAALLASAVWAPAAQACDLEDIAAGECTRGLRMPSVRQLVPPAARPSADADDAAELKECLRKLRATNARQLVSPGVRSATKEAPGTTLAAPTDTPVALSQIPTRVDGASLCFRYFANIGQTIPVPCNE
jgi:hypothetical protein